MLESSAKPSNETRPPRRIGVLLPLPLAGPYDYLVPEDIRVSEGDFVRVPFGNREMTGVVWKDTGDGKGVDPKRLKTILERLDAPPLPDVMRQFISWVAAYTLAAEGAVLKMAMSVPAALQPPKPSTGYVLSKCPVELKMTKARQRVLNVLVDGPPRQAAEVAREAAVGPSVVKGLAKAGILQAIDIWPDARRARPDWRCQGPELSPEQSDAADALTKQVKTGGFNVTVLDGVPGSGKTEVYFQAIAEALQQDRQALVLLPEIALSAQWLSRFEERFGAKPDVWHSDVSDSRRRETWRSVASGKASVVVGARSALFLPFPELGVVIVDEEHEGAFKQEEGVIYNARDMAVVRASLGDIPIVLASATPSLETDANVKSGRYEAQHLKERHAGAVLPDISLIDMRIEAPSGSRWLSPKLIEAVKETFDAGEQAMLFLNRRGYAPLTLCRTCGYRFQCPNCTAWLVEHRYGRGGRLQCHHCGFNSRFPDTCPSCEKEDTFAACGPGVERLAEEVAEIFPEARFEIAASDIISGPKAAAELVRRIEEHDVDLIIGTQIVAKGYHFPLLTLVGVVDADLGLSGGDLRAAERTYQLLYQVAGRAGRAERSGRVLLQTYMPEHAVMQALLSGDRDRFLEVETTSRKEAGMPPFGRLAALIISGTSEPQVEDTTRELARHAPRLKDILILGPAPAPLAMVRGRHRRRFLVKATKDAKLQNVVRQWTSSVKAKGNVKIQIDIDPYSFL